MTDLIRREFLLDDDQRPSTIVTQGSSAVRVTPGPTGWVIERRLFPGGEWIDWATVPLDMPAPPVGLDVGPASPIPCACFLVRDREGRVLSCSRRGFPDQIGLPGGKRDKGETLAEAAVRELREETGLIALGTPRLVFSDWCEGPADGKTHWTATFTCDEVDGAPRDMEEGIAVRWAWPEELQCYPAPFRLYNERVMAAVGSDVGMARRPMVADQ